MLEASECYGPIKMLLDKNNSAINGAVIEVTQVGHYVKKIVISLAEKILYGD